MNYCYSCMGELNGQTVCPYCGTDNTNPQNGPEQLQPGTVIGGKYILGRALGQGGFGITYLGINPGFGKVAVKEYYPKDIAFRTERTVSVSSGARPSYDEGLALAKREARMIQKVGNMPNVVHLHDVAEENGTLYIVMDYVDGETVADLVNRRGKLSWAETLRIMRPVITSLSRIHEKGILHRDVSPDNIMISREDGEPVLLDFGAAKNAVSSGNETHKSGTGNETRRSGMDNETHRSGEKHTYTMAVVRDGYSATEAYGSILGVTEQSDEYSVCATMYFMLTGVKPMIATSRAGEDEDVKLPRALGSDIPAYAEKALMKGFAVQRKDRYEDCAQLLRALEKKGGPNPVVIVAALLVIVIAAIAVLLTGIWPPKPVPLPTPVPTSVAVDPIDKPTQSPSPTPWKCMVCGTLNDYDDEACSSCLNPIDTTPEPWTCKWCGEKNAYSETTCRRCTNLKGTEPTPTPAPKSLSVKVGDHITFGHYPQTVSGRDSTPIEWRVLDVQGDRALVISEYGLDAQAYNAAANGTVWEACSLRKWLNGDFLDDAFGSEERPCVLMADVDNSGAQDNPDFGMDGGADTQDRVFLLSYAEAKKYFGTDNSRICLPTEFAATHGAGISAFTSERSVGWWLRSSGLYSRNASFVQLDGFLGSAVKSIKIYAVRPAFWLDLSATGSLDTAVSGADSSPAPAQVRCVNCGTLNDVGYSFCTECGQKISSAPASGSL